MALTLDFIREQFNVINNKHFEGKLITPTFEITHVKSYLGQYHWKYSYDDRIFYENVIRISDMFDRTDADITNTIAHEMIHLYIRQNKLRDTNKHHGRLFYAIADRLNREGGFHIARTDSVAGCGLRDKSTKKFIVAMFLDKTGKYFKFVINKKYINYYLKRFENYPEYYRNVVVVESTNDKAYAHMTQCYRSVRGCYINREQYNEVLRTEKVLYRFVTLGIRHDAA